MLVAKLETKTEFHGRVHSTTRPTEISSCGFETAISTDAIVPAYPPDRKGGFKEVQDATLVLVAILPESCRFLALSATAGRRSVKLCPWL